MTLKNKILRFFGHEPVEDTFLSIKIKEAEKQYSDILNIRKELNKSIHGGKNVVSLSKEALKNFPLMKWQKLAEGVMSRRRNVHFPDPFNPDKEIWNFDTQMIEGAMFGKHFHPDLMESCEAVRGSFINDTTGRIYKEGDIALFPHNETHEVRALENCLLRVLFRL